VDFGDRVPEDARFSDGKSGREMHNLYPHLYAEAVWQVVERVSGQGLIWRRPGYIGTQRFPCCWAGDTQVSWEGMAGALRGGLSAGFTGESCWSHDIGGFVGPHPSEELYIRWAQWGLLSPFARFHGVTPREPWDYGPRALEVVKSYAHLRYALLPYLMACAGESAASGLPMLRPLVMEFPDEPRVDTIDDQYLLGSDLLVAPVFNAGRATRPVYFPNAQWWPLHVSPSAQGPAIPILGPGDRVVDAPLERLPIFVRGGAVLPRYRQIPQHLKGPTPEAWQLDIYPGDSQRRLVIAENGFTVTIQYRFERGAGKLEISPAPIRLGVRLVDHRQPPFLRASGGGPLEAGDSAANFFADASQGVSVEFRL
jgi:alpha-D-xyloside xylohydrolase